MRSISEIQNRRLTPERSRVLDLDKQLTETEMSPDTRALAQVALGLIYCAHGQLGRAISHYHQSAQHLGHHPELAIEVGKRVLASHPEQALQFLKAALSDDKTRAATHVFMAQVRGMNGLLRQALEHLEKAHAMTPAWEQLLPMLADIHLQLGNQQQSQVFLDKYRDQQMRMELLARRLSDHRVSATHS